MLWFSYQHLKQSFSKVFYEKKVCYAQKNYPDTEKQGEVDTEMNRDAFLYQNQNTKISVKYKC